MAVNSTEVDILVEFVKRLRPRKTLEVGCNWGRELAAIKDLTKPYGIDKNSELTKGKRNLRCAEGDNIPWNNNYFDLSYTCGCLSHNEAPESILDEMIRVSKNHILLIEWIGSRTGTGYSNCKKGTSWIHDYEKLVSTKDIKILFNRKVPVKADLFHVLLLKKDKKKIVKIIERIKEKPPLFSINLGRLSFKVGK